MIDVVSLLASLTLAQVPPAIGGDAFHNCQTDNAMVPAWSCGFDPTHSSPNWAGQATPPGFDVCAGSGATHISGGWAHTMVRCGDSTVWGWGSNKFHTIGSASTGSYYGSVPVPPTLVPFQPAGFTPVTVAAGYQTTCSVYSDDALGTEQVRCWGRCCSGVCGTGISSCSPRKHRNPSQHGPVRLNSSAVLTLGAGASVDVGHYHACATDGTGIFCWGKNNRSQLGTPAGGLSAFAIPVTVPGAVAAVAPVAVTAGADHTCASFADGSVYCWGFDSGGRLDGTVVPPTTVTSNVALPVPLPFAPTAVDAGYSHTCATDGMAVACWGNGMAVTAVAHGLPDVASIVSGRNRSCAIDSAGNSVCWSW